jgi:hypothetical protein
MVAVTSNRQLVEEIKALLITQKRNLQVLKFFDHLPNLMNLLPMGHGTACDRTYIFQVSGLRGEIYTETGRARRAAAHRCDHGIR